jgi:hypothetical protein
VSQRKSHTFLELGTTSRTTDACAHTPSPGRNFQERYKWPSTHRRDCGGPFGSFGVRTVGGNVVPDEQELKGPQHFLINTGRPGRSIGKLWNHDSLGCRKSWWEEELSVAALLHYTLRGRRMAVQVRKLAKEIVRSHWLQQTVGHICLSLFHMRACGVYEFLNIEGNQSLEDCCESPNYALETSHLQSLIVDSSSMKRALSISH